MKHRIIKQLNGYRLLEVEEIGYNIDDLKGDCFNPNSNPNLDPLYLKTQEDLFESKVNERGVYGYILELWDPRIDHGWTHVDSCFGFIGEYKEDTPEYNHYIVDEFLSYIENATKCITNTKEGIR